MQQLRFDGRVAVVTGAGRGLGRSYALSLAARGASVVVNDLGVALDGSDEAESPAGLVVEEIATAGGVAAESVSDVSTAAGAQSIVDIALEHFGRIDIVVNNAGVVAPTVFPSTTLADLERHLAVHLGGSFNVTAAAWPHLTAQRYGRVVMITSTAIFGMAEVHSYSSAKAGIIGLGRNLALIGSTHGIKVNMVAPIGATRMTARFVVEDDMPTRHAITPVDKVAGLVALLAHEKCPTTSEIYAVAGDRVSRIFLGETPGAVLDNMTPETILNCWDAINDEDGYRVCGWGQPGHGAVESEVLAFGSGR